MERMAAMAVETQKDLEVEAVPAPDESQQQETDRFRAYLVAEHRRYRTLAWVLGICGFSIILLAVGLSMGGVMAPGIYNIAMSVAYLFILLMAIAVFTRTRPIKRRIKQLDGQPLSTIRDDDAPDGVRIDPAAQFRDMDDIYKILERDIRTEVIPDLPEYHRLRRFWLGLFAAALVVGLGALVLYYLCPAANLVATLLLLGAFVLVGGAFYVDRTRMRPLRMEWARRYGMTEMQMRDNLHDFKEGRR